jgi:hypothetical protein
MNTTLAHTTFSFFDPENLSDILYTLGIHKKDEEEFRYMALLYFNTIDINQYVNIPFTPIHVSSILKELKDPANPDQYKDFLNFCIQLTDLNPNGDPVLILRAVERIGANKLPNIAYYPLALFISIVEYYKTTNAGDDIDGYMEFTRGARINVNGGIDDVILFRFKSKTKGMEYYDYSSEDPTVIILLIQKLLEILGQDK